MITENTKQVINATLPAVKASARTITETFYPILFERYPETKALFNQTHQATGTQRQALANAVVAYASNLDRLEALGDAVALIVHKHVSLNILPRHYPLVGECLLAAIAEVLGEAATDEVIDAWGSIYAQLADILIAAEEEVYQTNEHKAGGWRGERAFVLTHKEVESEVITSFYFEPADGGALADFEPGQYLGVKLKIDGDSISRNYSLSNPPGQGRYRLSVKRDGLVSAYLHDQLQPGDSLRLTAPAGNFVLTSSERPLVLLTAGVGITPTISMLEPALSAGRAVNFIHFAINSATHAFRAELDRLQATYPQLSVSYCYSEPLPGDRCDLQGLVDVGKLQALMPHALQSDIYFLGPKPFMDVCFQALQELNVPAGQVHYEFFGPLQELQEAVAVA